MGHRAGRNGTFIPLNLRGSFLFALLIGMLAMLQQASPALATAPPNDNFSAAQQLSGNSASASGTTAGATLEAGEPPHYTSGNGSVWYSWMAPQTSVVRLDTCSGPGATKVQLYSGSSLVSLNELMPRSDSPNCSGVTGGDLRRFNVAAGTTYEISVIEYASDTTFTLALSAEPAPSNDDFATPQNLGQELNVDVDGTTAGTTVQPGEQGFYGSPDNGESVWYSWTAPKQMRVWIDNCNAASASAVTVYTGTELASLQEVDPHYAEPKPPYCEGNGLYGGRSEFLAHAGTTYMIRVYSDLYAEGAFHLRMREIVYDGSLSQTASATSIKKRKTVTYTGVLRNLGTIPIDPYVVMVTTKPGRLASVVSGVKYVSLSTTRGTCSRIKFEGVEPGAECKPGGLAPGDTMKVTARVRLLHSVTTWMALDFGGGILDDTSDDHPGNNPITRKNTKVRRGHH